MQLLTIPSHVHPSAKHRKPKLNTRYLGLLASTYSIKLKVVNTGLVNAWSVIAGGEYAEDIFDKHGLDSELSNYDERKYHKLNLGKPLAA